MRYKKSQKKVITKPKVEKPKVDVKKTSNIIEKVISNLDSMKGKTQVKEQVDQITLLRNEFNQFRTVIQNQIANQMKFHLLVEVVEVVKLDLSF